MADNYHAIWDEIGLDLERHAELRAAGAEPFGKVVLQRERRPQGMAYFDDAMRGAQTTRVKELHEFRKAGGKVVGLFCVFVPEDLIMAAGAVPVALCAGSGFATPAADRVLPMSTCALVKAAYGFEVERICPYSLLSDLIVGETTCDGKKKMYELFGELRSIYVMEVPQRKSEQARALFRREIDELRGVLEHLTGNDITEHSLAEATALHEAKRAAMQRIAGTRRAEAPPISGVDALLVNQLSFTDGTRRFTAAANTLADELEAMALAGEGAYEGRRPRILVTGCPMALPNWKLPHLVEACGGAVVAEESCVGTRYFEPRATGSRQTLEEQLGAIAARQLETHCASFTPNDERVADILRLAEWYKVDGVIQYTLQFCHTFAHEAVKVEGALREAGVPSLRVETDYSPQDTEQLRLRVQAFLEILG